VIQNRAERAAGGGALPVHPLREVPRAAAAQQPDRAAIALDTDNDEEEDRPHNLVFFQGEGVPQRVARTEPLAADLAVSKAEGWDIFKGLMHGVPVVYLVQHRVLGTNTEFEVCREGRAVQMTVDIPAISADKLGPELSTVATNGIPGKRRKYIYSLPGTMRVKTAIELVNFGQPRITQQDGGKAEVEPKLFAIRLLMEEENPKPVKLSVGF